MPRKHSRRRAALGSSKRVPPLPKHFIGYKKCERWGATTSICVEGKKYGFTATLVSDKGGALPISTPDVRTPGEALSAAKRFLRNVHGKHN